MSNLGSLVFAVPRGTFLLAAGIALAGSGLAAAVPGPANTFRVGKRLLVGRPKTICVIEGKWADGAPFRYEGWDNCGKMHVRSVTEKEYKEAPSLGEHNDVTVADIPQRAEVLEISNEFSTTLVFRDRRGIQREILSGD